MNITLDANCISSLARPPRRTKKRATKKRGRVATAVGLLRLDMHVQRGDVSLNTDSGLGLLDEWRRTCGTDELKQLIVKWRDKKAIVLVQLRRNLEPHQTQYLRTAGFADAGDRLIVRIALNAQERNLVTNDPDFWDPRRTSMRGNSAAPVHRYLLAECGITSIMLGELFSRLPN